MKAYDVISHVGVEVTRMQNEPLAEIADGTAVFSRVLGRGGPDNTSS